MYLLSSGRSVMLDQPRKAGGRSVSHMLTSHGGELFIHTIAASRSPLEDPPSISEGVGGRVTDYRIKVHAHFLQCICTFEFHALLIYSCSFRILVK